MSEKPKGSKLTPENKAIVAKLMLEHLKIYIKWKEQQKANEQQVNPRE